MLYEFPMTATRARADVLNTLSYVLSNLAFCQDVLAGKGTETHGKATLRPLIMASFTAESNTKRATYDFRNNRGMEAIYDEIHDVIVQTGEVIDEYEAE